MTRFLLIMMLSFGISSAAIAQENRVLTVVGTGKVATTPDMATINLGVHAQAETAADALALNSKDMNAVLAVLTGSGIEDRDIQTSNLSLHPRWSNYQSTNEQPKIIGFEASNSVSVRVRDLNSLGSVLDLLTKAGANRLNGISFGLQQPRPHLDKARELAVKDARAKAQLYASAAELSLGPIQSLSEAGGGQPRPHQMVRMEAAMGASNVPIAQGELTISASVTVVYAIE